MRREIVAVEDVVAEHEGARAVADELPPDDEGLGKTLGRGLHGVGKLDAPLAPAAEKLLEARRVLRAWR